MKRIKVTVMTNKIGSECSRYIEVEDDATEEEINQDAWECACDMIDFNWDEEQECDFYVRYNEMSKL